VIRQSLRRGPCARPALGPDGVLVWHLRTLSHRGSVLTQMPTLHIKTGPLAGQQIEVKRNLTIGREDADLAIDDGELSRRHAIVRLIDGGLEVEDLGSKNGTLVDGRPIEGPTLMAGGARLEVGTTVFEVVDVPQAQAAQPTPSAAVLSTADAARAGPVSPATPVASPVAPAQAPLRAAVGEFHPPTRRRSHLASRSWAPVVLSFGTALLTAVGLVIYFALR
jgi:pSer/pThr/pTyr-binding forkhead associated (FHA) protein